MSKFYKDLKEGLEDVVAYKKGKLTLRFGFFKFPKDEVKRLHQRKQYQCQDVSRKKKT